MRASRLVQLLLVLQRRGRTTAADLAAELEVSVRTIYRDVEALGMAGVPIYGESGPGGGVQLIGGYETRLTGLTESEAAALSLAGVPSAAHELGLGSVLVAAQSKVDAALPAELRAQTDRLRQRFHVDMPGWFRRPETVPALPTLSAAVWAGRRVDIRYRRRERTVRRRVDPLGLVLKGGVWYLVAGARRPDGLRTYRVSRILAVTARDEPVERPADFDLATAWEMLNRSFERDLRRYVVHGLLPGSQLWRLRHALPEPSATNAIDSAGAERPDGRCEVTITSESLDVAHEELLRLGAHLEVLDPPELRAGLHESGVAMARRNAPTR